MNNRAFSTRFLLSSKKFENDIVVGENDLLLWRVLTKDLKGFLSSNQKLKFVTLSSCADLARQTRAPRVAVEYTKLNFHYETAFMPQVFSYRFRTVLQCSFFLINVRLIDDSDFSFVSRS